MSWLPAATHPPAARIRLSSQLCAPLTNLNRHVIISAEVLMPQRNADTACSHSQLVKVHIFLRLQLRGFSEIDTNTYTNVCIFACATRRMRNI